MTMFRTLLMASAFSASMAAAQAQTPPAAAADPHHPGTTGTAAPAAPAVAAPGGMMGGMMGGDMGAMMQNMMPMMRMMMARGGMEGMGGPMDMMAPNRVEGRIAFLRTEIKITDGQLPLWNAYADVLRQNAKSMTAMQGTMMPPTAPNAFPDHAAHQIKMLSARLDAAKAGEAAGRALYTVLTDAQKKTADELLAPAMGRM